MIPEVDCPPELGSVNVSVGVALGEVEPKTPTVPLALVEGAVKGRNIIILHLTAEL